jgi:hypothetical protein
LPRANAALPPANAALPPAGFLPAGFFVLLVAIRFSFE